MSIAPYLLSKGMEEESSRFGAIRREYSDSAGSSQGREIGLEVNKTTQVIIIKQISGLCGAIPSCGYVLGTMQR